MGLISTGEPAVHGPIQIMSKIPASLYAACQTMVTGGPCTVAGNCSSLGSINRAAPVPAPLMRLGSHSFSQPLSSTYGGNHSPQLVQPIQPPVMHPNLVSTLKSIIAPVSPPMTPIVSTASDAGDALFDREGFSDSRTYDGSPSRYIRGTSMKRSLEEAGLTADDVNMNQCQEIQLRQNASDFSWPLPNFPRTALPLPSSGCPDQLLHGVNVTSSEVPARKRHHIMRGISLKAVAPEFAESAPIVPVDLIHNRRPFSCHYRGCSKTFRNPQTLKMHLKTHDAGETLVRGELMIPWHGSGKAGQNKKIPSRCPVCGSTFVGLYELRRHYGRKHLQGEKPYACRKCSKRFFVQVDLRDHEKVCGESLVCRCGLSFAFKCNLVNHMRLKPSCQSGGAQRSSTPSQSPSPPPLAGSEQSTCGGHNKPPAIWGASQQFGGLCSEVTGAINFGPDRTISPAITSVEEESRGKSSPSLPPVKGEIASVYDSDCRQQHSSVMGSLGVTESTTKGSADSSQPSGNVRQAVADDSSSLKSGRGLEGYQQIINSQPQTGMIGSMNLVDAMQTCIQSSHVQHVEGESPQQLHLMRKLQSGLSDSEAQMQASINKGSFPVNSDTCHGGSEFHVSNMQDYNHDLVVATMGTTRDNMGYSLEQTLSSSSHFPAEVGSMNLLHPQQKAPSNSSLHQNLPTTATVTSSSTLLQVSPLTVQSTSLISSVPSQLLPTLSAQACIETNQFLPSELDSFGLGPQSMGMQTSMRMSFPLAPMVKPENFPPGGIELAPLPVMKSFSRTGSQCSLLPPE